MMPGQTASRAAQIEACRDEMARMSALWRSLAARSSPRAVAEAQVFNQMAVALDGRFPARACDGPTLHELRLLTRGVTLNGGYFPSDHGTRWRPETSVTGYRPGERIALSEPVFSRLVTACLAEAHSAPH